MKSNVLAFGDILHVTVESITVSGENVEVTQTFTYLGSVIHSSTSCELGINRRLGRAWSATNSLDEGVWRCRYLCKRRKIRVFRSLILPVLLYSCETWTLTGELRRRLIFFGTMSLRRILDHRWHDYMSNDQVLREAGQRQVTSIVRERQLHLYGHVDSLRRTAIEFCLVRNPRGWTTLRGCVRLSPI